MLRFNHRQSRDIDLFVPDPQYLGYVNPRLSDAAENLTHHYTEAAEYLKLFMPTGEIDIVVGESLTSEPFEDVAYEERCIRVETSAEIVAKKMFHRGHMAKARDLFDLCAIADMEPDAIPVAKPFFARHGAQFLKQIRDRAEPLEEEFSQIDALDYRRPFGECLELAGRLLS